MALSASRSGYYQWVGTEQSVRAEANAELLKEIERAYHEHKGRCGSPRITQQLRQEGVMCGENRVARLMRENELYSCSTQEGVSATDDLAALSALGSDGLLFERSTEVVLGHSPLFRQLLPPENLKGAAESGPCLGALFPF